MADRTRILTGDCTVEFEGTRDRTQRGHVVTRVKPARTVVAHDASGSHPVAWRTGPDEFTVEPGREGFSLTAAADGQLRSVRSNTVETSESVPVSEAGVPVGDCPLCTGQLVRTRGAVRCLDCAEQYGLPSGATVLDSTCPDCGLPQMRVERGESFDLCVDYACESLSDVVRERFDEAYDCPDCGAPLRVRSPDGRLFFGCEAYPDCETSFSFPAGVVTGACECGLPRFRTASGVRCLDGTCEHDRPASETRSV